MSPRSPTPPPEHSHPAEVSQGSRVGSSPQSSHRPLEGLSWCPVGVSLCEVIHRSGGRASSASRPQEQRVLCWQSWKERETGSPGEGGVYLDGCGFGPKGEVALLHRGGPHQRACGQVHQLHPRGRCAGPSQGWEGEGSGAIWLPQYALCSYPDRACVPHVMEHLRCHPLLRFLLRLSCRRKLSQGPAERQQPHEGACSGKNKAPSLQAFAASPGAPGPEG